MHNVQIIFAHKNKYIINHRFPKTWIIKKHQQTKIEHKNSHLPSLAWKIWIWITLPHSTPKKKTSKGENLGK
jgi:hypothetical protein